MNNQRKMKKKIEKIDKKKIQNLINPRDDRKGGTKELRTENANEQ